MLPYFLLESAQTKKIIVVPPIAHEFATNWTMDKIRLNYVLINRFVLNHVLINRF